MNTGRHVFLRWICLATGCHPCSTLRLVAKQHFCRAVKSWKNVMPVQLDTIITFVCVHVVEYVPSTRQHVFLTRVTGHWETGEKYPYGFSHVISNNLYFPPPISCWEWGYAERAVPTHECVSDHTSMQY